MQLTIDGKVLFYRNIESLEYDEEAGEAVIRMISGAEHRKPVKSKEKADDIFGRLIADMTLALA
tara:strand:+ start:83 stop:274 length:192 start_codon:yes stop_codon:yes gene_type:complete